MSQRTPVLGDHKRVRSKLITPFNDKLGPMRDVSWINTMIPELLWIALLHGAYGHHVAVQIVTAFTRALRAHSAGYSDKVWVAAGKFSEIPQEALREIVVGMGTNHGDALLSALKPLAACYPTNPFNNIYNEPFPAATPEKLDTLSRVVAGLYDRSDRDTMMVQATAIWVAFDSGRLKVNSDLALASFPRIEEYPTTELSRRVGGSIRSTLNLMFGESQFMASDGRWPVDFWNQGLLLQPCEFKND